MEWYDALDLAKRVVFHGAKAEDLLVGQWGAIGKSEIGAYHSMVGIKSGLSLQVDSDRGPLSIVSHDANVAHYRATHGEEMELFAPTGENPHY